MEDSFSSTWIPEWVKNFFRRKNYGAGSFYPVGHKGPVWLDVSKPAELYYEIPELQIVIKKFADLFSNGEIVLLDKYGKKVPKEKAPEFYKLFNNPNPLQSGNAFMWEYCAQCWVFGNQLIYKNKPSVLLKVPQTLQNIPAYNTTPIATGKFLNQLKIEDIISGYDVRIDGVTTRYQTKDVIWSKHSDLQNPIVGKSPLYGLKFPLSNTKLAYKYRNIIMGAEGAGLGIISGSNKDASGAVPLKKSERERIEQQFMEDRGVDRKSKIMVAEGNVTFTPTVYETMKLGLFEEVDANLITLINFFGLDVNLFSKNSTFENKKHGIIASYQDAIIPFADSFGQKLTTDLEIEKNYPGCTAGVSYAHVQVLKEDNTTEIKNFDLLVKNIIASVGADIITPAEAKKKIAELEEKFGLSYTR